MAAAEAGSGKAIVARIAFDGENWQSRRGHEFGRCPKICSSFYNGDRRKYPDEIMKQVLSKMLVIKRPTPSGTAIRVIHIFDCTDYFFAKI